MSTLTVILVVVASLCLAQSQVGRRRIIHANMVTRNRMSRGGGYRLPARWRRNGWRMTRRAPTGAWAQPPNAFRSMIGSLLGMQRRSIATSPSFLAAKTLGCAYGMESDSMMRYYYPKGCRPAEDFCPFKYPGRHCVWTGTIGMCCPFYVNQRDIGASTSLAQMKSLSDMF